ncbi:MAG TPA: universal stress protein [Gaiellaceae bacterium]|nr:universal stress protein [Gaiellaceae bacterium]
MYPTILWATDGSHEADVALHEALRLLEPGGRLIAFHCDQRFTGGRIGGLPVYPDETDRQRRIEERVEELRADGVDVDLVFDSTSRDAASEIAAAAETAHVDAIVCGTRGLHGVVGFLNGRSAARVLRHASVPVIVVPAHAPLHADPLETEGAPV